MKKVKFFIPGLMVCFAIFKLSAEGDLPHFEPKNISYGKQIYGKEVVDSIQANGYLKLDGTTITSFLQVNGKLEALGAQIEAMQINGEASMSNCKVAKKSFVNGMLVATLTTFSEELSVSSRDTVLNSCYLRSLHILKGNGDPQVQIVELNGKTKIDGTITFESGNGEVILNSDSEIRDGVVGGKIRKI